MEDGHKFSLHLKTFENNFTRLINPSFWRRLNRLVLPSSNSSSSREDVWRLRTEEVSVSNQRASVQSLESPHWEDYEDEVLRDNEKESSSLIHYCHCATLLCLAIKTCTNDLSSQRLKDSFSYNDKNLSTSEIQ